MRYEKNELIGKGSENRRNGYHKKTAVTEQGELSLGVPRDRNGKDEPQIVPKRQTRLEGFDEKVLAMYDRGMTVRDIESQLKDIYGTEVSPTLISIVTDAVMDEASALWGFLSEQPFWSTRIIMSKSSLSLNLQRY